MIKSGTTSVIKPWASFQHITFFVSEDHLRGTKPELRGAPKAGNDVDIPDPELIAREALVNETVKKEGAAGECSKE